MARDRGAEIEALIAQADASEIARAEAALEKRRRELGLGAGGEGAVAPALSDVVERRTHADGLLQAEVRRQRRKDGSYGEFGPYWYFRYVEDGRVRNIYLGKTDEPEAALAAKRGDEERRT